MRHLPVRPLVTGAVCAALALGATAPVAAAGDTPSGDGARQTPAAAPSAAALRAQVTRLRQAGEVLTPVSRLLDAILRADGHQISKAEAKAHTTAVHTAIAHGQIVPAPPFGPAEHVHGQIVPAPPFGPAEHAHGQIPPAPPFGPAAGAPVGAPHQAAILPDYQRNPPSANTPASQALTAPGNQAAQQGRQQGHRQGHQQERQQARYPGRGEQAPQSQGTARQPAARGATLPSATRRAPELQAQSLTRLKTAVDTLIARSTAGSRTAVDRQIPVVVRASVDFVAATLAAGDLPAPARHGRPTSDTRPATPHTRPHPAPVHP
jgi:hypothetical protein